MSKKKTYQFDLSIRLMAEADGVDSAFEAALGKLDPEFVQIRSEVAYKDVTPRSSARIDPNEVIECGVIVKEQIGIVDGDEVTDPEKIREGLAALIESIMGDDMKVTTEPSPEQLLKEALGEDN